MNIEKAKMMLEEKQSKIKELQKTQGLLKTELMNCEENLQKVTNLKFYTGQQKEIADLKLEKNGIQEELTLLNDQIAKEKMTSHDFGYIIKDVENKARQDYEKMLVEVENEAQKFNELIINLKAEEQRVKDEVRNELESYTPYTDEEGAKSIFISSIYFNPYESTKGRIQKIISQSF